VVLRYPIFKLAALFTAIGAFCVTSSCANNPAAFADPATAGSGAHEGQYRIQPGDILFISVWRETELQREVLVRPDGGFSYPLIGEVQASGLTLTQLHEELAGRLKEFVPDGDVTVMLQQIQGNKVYVIGKVHRPGEIVLTHNADVMQVLSMAGGMTQYADADDIVILRRDNGQQVVYKFDYDDVKQGEKLQQNIILKSGDVVVVP
jgi:polysaccharide export outer membrane protein